MICRNCNIEKSFNCFEKHRKICKQCRNKKRKNNKRKLKYEIISTNELNDRYIKKIFQKNGWKVITPEIIELKRQLITLKRTIKNTTL